MPIHYRYRVLLLGDFYYGESYPRTGANVLREKGYGHSTAYLRPFVDACDTVIVNLEAPLVGGPEHSGKESSGHRANPERTTDALAGLGVDAVSLGNDHALDAGKDGLRDTLAALAARGITAFGAGKNRAQAEQPYRIPLPDTVGGGEIAVYGFLESPPARAKEQGLFAGRWSPGTAQGSASAVIAPNAQRPDGHTFHLAFPHWGSAYTWRSAQQEAIARRLSAAGYDLIMGHGSHALQEIAHADGRWTIYGLGNGNLQSQARWRQHEEASGIAPYGFWAVLEVSGDARGRRVSLNLYPVYSDNRATGFQPRPVSAGDFDQVVAALADRSGSETPAAGTELIQAQDDLGHHLRLHVADWPVMVPPTAKAPGMRASASTPERPPEAAAGALSAEGQGPSPQTTVKTVSVDGLRFSVTAVSARLDGADDAVTEVVVPETVDGVPVRTIAKGAFRDNHTLTSVTLPDSVQTLGADAFHGCTALVWAELPATLEVINSRAFEGCTSLRTVHLPYRLTRIGTRAFAQCPALSELPHFVYSGTRTDGEVLRDLVETALPTDLAYIGAEAFADCTALRHVVIGHKVHRIHARSFENCTSLATVWLHAGVQTIENRAFAGCAALARVHLPANIGEFAADAFDPAVQVVTPEGSVTKASAAALGLTVTSGALPSEPITSAFGDSRALTVADVLSRPEMRDGIADAYQIRPPVAEITRDQKSSNATQVRPSRFRFDDGVYRPEPGAPADPAVSEDPDVTITMVGDLMCGFRQQESALVDGEYDFTATFDEVRPILARSDLAIGNLESTVSETYPYMVERTYVDDRPHLNSPFAYLAAVRDAGFDAVVNAQNHMYDAGVTGVLQTLDAANRANLIHTGMFAGPGDVRHALFEIKGMSIAVLAYLDPARQRMKQANFTAEGLAAMANPFDADQMATDIAAARAAGAEFVLVYAHWGREFTAEISARQERFAQMIADGGADYVFGSHSHCPQHYTVLRSADGRSVPVVYSGANFVADIQRAKPISQDTFIGTLTLTRDTGGRVRIAHDGYIPGRILDTTGVRGFVTVVPTEQLEAGAFGYDPMTAEEDTRRIASTMRDRYRRLTVAEVRGGRAEGSAVSADATGTATGRADELVQKYSLREARLAIQQPTDDGAMQDLAFRQDGATGRWRRATGSARGEAVLLCAGSLMYDRHLESTARVGDGFEFRSMFTQLRRALSSGDLAIGSLGTLVADMYPTSATLTSAIAGGHFSNARTEFLNGLRYAGFDALALANPYNLDAGVRGLVATETAVRNHAMVPSGLGEHRTPIFEVNGIRVALLSFTAHLHDDSGITPLGREELLNVFDPERAERAIAAARTNGAQFVLGYLDFRSSDNAYGLRERLATARAMADAGADYVVCTLPTALTTYVRYRTGDGRSVPIATSLGTLVSGQRRRSTGVSALLRVVLRATGDGQIEVADSYIPVERVDPGHDLPVLAVPAHELYHPTGDADARQLTQEQVADRLGDELTIDSSRKSRVSSPFEAHFSPADVSQILGVPFSAEDRATLGEAYNQPMPGLVTRKSEVRPGTALATVNHISSRAHLDRATMADAVERGAIMMISEEPHEELPTLVVPHTWNAYVRLMQEIRSRFDPLTVAITGTAGKTTTKELMSEVFDRQFRTLHVQGNFNTLATTSVVLQKLTDDDEAYVQEVHGGSPGSARSVSRLIRPHIAVITSIGEGHLNQMGSIENVIEGKMQIADGLREDGVLIINHDNEYLRQQQPPVRTIRYGIDDPESDYYAQNVRTTDNGVEFQVAAPDGTFDATLNIHGLHNVSNALAVFAAAREADVPAHTIIAGLSRHRPSANRQNILSVGGYTIYLDAYNSNVLSLTSALETLLALPVRPGGRRIAVIGDMGEQGGKVRENHELIGERIGASAIDLVFCIGEGTQYTARVSRAAGKHALHFRDADELIRTLRGEMRPGDALLFKAAGSVDLATMVVYPLFGRIDR